MLTLTRSVGESIRIGEDIEVYVVEVRGGTVRLGFKAPREVAIHRDEVYRQIAEANALAAEVAADAANALAAFSPAPSSAPAVAPVPVSAQKPSPSRVPAAVTPRPATSAPDQALPKK